MIADKIKNARTILYYITTVRLDFFQIGIMILFSVIASGVWNGHCYYPFYSEQILCSQS